VLDRAQTALDTRRRRLYSTMQLNIVNQLDRTLTAVADPTRRAILDRLSHGPARVTDIAAPFRISLAAVSKHIKVLEEAGLVNRAREGREHQLTLNGAPLRDVARWAHRYERFWTDRLDRLERFFAAKRRDR
jgi:DNA-binding transcriptional ArsR family regulator